VPLASTYDEQLARLSQGRRRKLRLAGRRLREAGRVRIERATAATIDESLDVLFVLHAARWQRRGLPGVLAEPSVRALHREAAPAFLQHGVLRLHVLRLDERPIAALYGFARGSRWYSYLDGFDPEFEELSPGTVLVAHAIEEAIAEGRTAFDFLRGAERYKYSWGAADEATYEITIDARVCGA
jgi:CelD/BcsL family acetyltransferase involved in cellulose biosynthesis